MLYLSYEKFTGISIISLLFKYRFQVRVQGTELVMGKHLLAH
jgi:hypothetical protein